MEFMIQPHAASIVETQVFFTLKGITGPWNYISESNLRQGVGKKTLSEMNGLFVNALGSATAGRLIV